MIDGVHEYGFGMWTKFFMTNPKRIYQKPERILVGRLGFKADGDADLGVFITKGNYEFWAMAARSV